MLHIHFYTIKDINTTKILYFYKEPKPPNPYSESIGSNKESNPVKKGLL